MTNAHVVSRSPSSIEIGFKGRDFADAYKVFIDPNLDRATIAIDNSLHPAANRPKNRQGRPLSGGSITKDVREMIRRSGKVLTVPRHKEFPTGNPENIDTESAVHFFVFGTPRPHVYMRPRLDWADAYP
jgi:hypothetical protein